MNGTYGLHKGDEISEPIENLMRTLATEKPKRFSYKDLISFTSNLSTKIGSGAFGDVYKGQFPSGVEVAVKVLIETGIVEEVFMAEVSTMGRTYHRNLVKLYGFCFDANMKALVYEYMKNGSLDRVLYNNHFSIEWEKLYGIAVESAKALAYLHDGCYEKIIHHDIKAGNVLLDLNFCPKIADFGLAKLLDRDLSHFTMSRIRGTSGYAAPETWIPSSEITCKCDVYSFGMMLFEILRRKRNSDSNGWFPKQAWEKFENGKIDDIIEECSVTVANREKAKLLCMVALWCIQFTPQTRPSMSTVATMLEKEIQVTTPPNPFLSSNLISSMQPFQYVQECINSKGSSSADGSLREDTFQEEVMDAPYGAGMLDVIIHEAEDVEGYNHTNPYARVLFLGEERKTKRVKQNKDPRWHEQFTYALEEPPTNEKIYIEVVSASSGMGILHPKEILGYIDINLSDVVSNKHTNKLYDLIDSKNGRIKIELEWRTLV